MIMRVTMLICDGICLFVMHCYNVFHCYFSSLFHQRHQQLSGLEESLHRKYTVVHNFIFNKYYKYIIPLVFNLNFQCEITKICLEHV